MRLHILQTFNPSALSSVLFQSGKYLVLFLFLLLCFSGTVYAQCPVTVDAGPDQFICNPPNPVMLEGDITGAYLSFVWTPTTGMTGATTLTPTVNVNQTTTYVLKVKAVDTNNNLVQNGDFEQGNTSFSSDYVYNPGFTMFPFGSYEVTSTPASFPDCPDHTSGSGSYMVVDGAQTPNLQVWCQTVPVTANTDYNLSAWALSFVTNAPFALLKFTINGVAVGSTLNVSPPQCLWRPFSAIWNSGANTSATICIEDITVTGSNNDFGIDDIALNPICTATDTVKVQVLNVQAVSNPAFINLPCAGALLTLNGAGSSTGPNISYLWDTSDGNIVSGATTLTPAIDQPGIYTLTVTYDYGSGQCTKSTNVTVILNPNAISATIQPPQPLGCGGTTVNLVGQSSQGAVSYAWSTLNGNIVSGANSATAVVNQPGTYTLTVTNIINGCSATAQTTVTVANNPPVANANASGPINCLFAQTNLSGQGSSTGGSIQYNWSSPNGGVIVSGQNTINAVAGSGGLYILKVLNTSNTCFTLDSVLIVADTVHPKIMLTPPGVLNCLVDTLPIQVTITPTNAVPLWTAGPGGSIASGANSTTLKVLTPATYQLVVTDTTNGCTATLSVTIGIDIQKPLAVTAKADTLSCQQTSVVLNGTGSSTGANITYKWTTLIGGNVVSGANTLNPIVNAAGTYQLLVTNTTNGCTDTAAVQVFADANVIVAIANAEDSLDCKVKTVGLNSTGSSTLPGLTFAWSIAAGSIGNFTSALNGPTATVDQPGTYQLVLTNPASGCTAVDLAVVSLDTISPKVQIALPDTITCVQPNLNLQASNMATGNHFTYAWTASGGGNIVSGANTLMPLVNAAGQYLLISKDTINGCSSQTSATVIIATGAPIAIINGPDTLDCAVLSFNLTSNGSSTGPEFVYAWTSSLGGNIVSGADQPNPLIDESGKYNLLITNSTNGCIAQDSVNVNRDTVAPSAIAGKDTVLNCLNASLNLIANPGFIGNYQFNWSTPDGNILGNPAVQQINIDKNGSYRLIVTDNQNACTATDTVIVSANFKAPDLNLPAPGRINCLNATVPLNSSSSVPVLNYQWQTNGGNILAGQNTAIATADKEGVYILTITNPINGCIKTDSVTVIIDTIPPIVATVDTLDLTCQNPLLQLSAFTTSQHPQYQWTTKLGNIISGANTGVALIDKAGVYNLVVQDSLSGCKAGDSIVVVAKNVKPSVSAGPDATLNCITQIINLQGMAGTYGIPIYKWFALGPGNIIGSINNLSVQADKPGIYVLEVSDSITGCMAFDTVQIKLDTLHPTAKIGVPQILTCNLKQFNLLTLGNNPPGVSYIWTASNGGNIQSAGNTNSPLIDAPGTYQLVVAIPANGCTASASVQVTQNISPPPISIDVPAPLTCANPNRTLQGNPANGNYLYQWSTLNGNIVSGTQSPKPVVNKAGTYQLVLTDFQTGCRDSALVLVTQDTMKPVVAIQAPLSLTCSTQSIQLAGVVTSPATGSTVLWTTINGQIDVGKTTLNPGVSKPGLYTMTVTSQQNGCTASSQVTVLQNITPPVAKIGPGFKINCTVPSGDLNGQISTGQGALNYLWTTSQGKILGNPVAPIVLVGGAGIYVLKVTDGLNGCTDTASVLVTIDTTPPFVQILPTLPLTCLRDSAMLSGKGSSLGTSFVPSWTDFLGTPIIKQQGLNATVSDTGLYILAIVNQVNGCSSMNTVQVGMDRTPPDANAGPPLLLYCTQNKVRLLGGSTTSGVLFSWSTLNGIIDSNALGAQPLVSTPGNYVLTVTNPINGCTAVDNTNVSQIDLPSFTLNVVQPTCLDSKSLIAFENVKGVGPYTFAVDGGVTFLTNKIFENLEPATYYPVVRDQYGCTSFQTVTIAVPNQPVVKLKEFELIEIGTGYTIIPQTKPPADSILAWQWSPVEHLSCTDCPSPTASPLETTEYTLTITDFAGCTAEDHIQIRVNPSRYIYHPNIISPNGDGVNDHFTLFGRNVGEIELLQVYNRWGALVYEKTGLLFNDELDGWDGRVKGEPPLPGVYVWQARIRYADGVIEWFKGDVTVVR